MAAFASVGLPGFANFAAELLIFFGGFAHFDPTAGLSRLEVATVLALWGVVISAVYMLRAYRSVFMGETPAALAGATDLSPRQIWPVVLLLAALLLTGLYPNLLLNLLASPAGQVAAAG
jgi:NADH-quinone oxidoreductase subunit M